MFYTIRDHTVFSHPQPPAGLHPIAALHSELTPSVISTLHAHLHAWGEMGLSPGPITPDRIWCNTDGALAFVFNGNDTPLPISHVGMAQELAAWFVLLDKWTDASVVIAHARAVWTVQELAGALTFTSKPFLPAALVYMPPHNWERVAMALAVAVGDGALDKTTA
ncbi:MAG: hypothetical protein WAU00_23495 [Caldilinea sp.]